METRALARHHKRFLQAYTHRVRIQTLPTSPTRRPAEERIERISPELTISERLNATDVLSEWKHARRSAAELFESGSSLPKNRPQHNKLQALATGSTNRVEELPTAAQFAPSGGQLLCLPWLAQLFSTCNPGGVVGEFNPHRRHLCTEAFFAACGAHLLSPFFCTLYGRPGRCAPQAHQKRPGLPCRAISDARPASSSG